MFVRGALGHLAHSRLIKNASIYYGWSPAKWIACPLKIDAAACWLRDGGGTPSLKLSERTAALWLMCVFSEDLFCGEAVSLYRSGALTAGVCLVCSKRSGMFRFVKLPWLLCNQFIGYLQWFLLTDLCSCWGERCMVEWWPFIFYLQPIKKFFNMQFVLYFLYTTWAFCGFWNVRLFLYARLDNLFV